MGFRIRNSSIGILKKVVEKKSFFKLNAEDIILVSLDNIAYFDLDVVYKKSSESYELRDGIVEIAFDLTFYVNNKGVIEKVQKEVQLELTTTIGTTDSRKLLEQEVNEYIINMEDDMINISLGLFKSSYETNHKFEDLAKNLNKKPFYYVGQNKKEINQFLDIYEKNIKETSESKLENESAYATNKYEDVHNLYKVNLDNKIYKEWVNSVMYSQFRKLNVKEFAYLELIDMYAETPPIVKDGDRYIVKHNTLVVTIVETAVDKNLKQKDIISEMAIPFTKSAKSIEDLEEMYNEYIDIKYDQIREAMGTNLIDLSGDILPIENYNVDDFYLVANDDVTKQLKEAIFRARKEKMLTPNDLIKNYYEQKATPNEIKEAITIAKRIKPYENLIKQSGMKLVFTSSHGIPTYVYQASKNINVYFSMTYTYIVELDKPRAVYTYKDATPTMVAKTFAEKSNIFGAILIANAMDGRVNLEKLVENHLLSLKK